MARLGGADIDAARDGLPGEWDIPADDYEALKNSMSSRSQYMMLGVVRDNMSIFALLKGAADRGEGA